MREVEMRTEFAIAATALDQAEDLADNRRRGPTDAMLQKITWLEERIAASRPLSLEDWRWLARRLARAHENGWCREAVAPLLCLAEAA